MFKDRKEAGQRLAKKFNNKLKTFSRPVIIALPRGGVPVAYEIANKFNYPLDIFTVKKIGAPGNPELALGAVTEFGDSYMNQKIIENLKIGEKQLMVLTQNALNKAKEQGILLRGKNKPFHLRGKDIILVDDGIATGATIKAAIKILRKLNVNKLVLMVPVCSQDSWHEINKLVDEFYVLDCPFYFWAVGKHYMSFPQVTNDEVIRLLMQSSSAQNIKDLSHGTSLSGS